MNDDIALFHHKIQYEPSMGGTYHMTSQVLTGDERQAIQRVAEAASQLSELQNLLHASSTDMHMTSSRPCGTCRNLTEKLGWPYGCYEWQEKKRRLDQQRQEEKNAT